MQHFDDVDAPWCADRAAVSSFAPSLARRGGLCIKPLEFRVRLALNECLENVDVVAAPMAHQIELSELDRSLGMDDRLCRASN